MYKSDFFKLKSKRFYLLKLLLNYYKSGRYSPLRERENWIRKGHREEASGLSSVFWFLTSVLVTQTFALSLLNSTCMYQLISLCVLLVWPFASPWGCKQVHAWVHIHCVPERDLNHITSLPTLLMKKLKLRETELLALVP